MHLPLASSLACSFRFVGRVPYALGLMLQAEAHARVLGGGQNEILGLTHDPVMTLGRHADSKNLLVGEEELSQRGIALARTDRGGDITYHGPEQVLLYPIMRVPHPKPFVAALERAMIAYLRTRGIEAALKEGAPGVFVGDAKIGFVGLRIKDGISTHGLALNLGGSLQAFSLTHPCGARGQRITSIEALTGERPSHASAAQALSSHLMLQ